MSSTFDLVMRNMPNTIDSSALTVNPKFNFPQYLTESHPTHIPSWIIREQQWSLFLKKYPYHSTDVDTTKAALSSFYESEQRSLTYNLLLPEIIKMPKTKVLFQRWKKHISLIIGSKPNVSFGRFTSGATVGLKTGNLPLERVMECSVTPELKSFLESHYLTESSPNVNWTLCPFDLTSACVTAGSKLEVVPKTALTDRVICKEPSVNAYYQSMLGIQLSQKLTRIGRHIPSAQVWHRFLAEYASVTGEFCTDDMKMASDLLYESLFKNLLPTAWYDWLNATRSHSVIVPSSPLWDHSHSWKLQKFSTMGNGFTFELETLLFYSLITAVMDINPLKNDEVYVYGDDLIYPTEYASPVRNALSHFGFIVNVEKSFSTGSFRESCGGDYINGHDVRPIYFKLEGATSYEKTILANQLYTKYCVHNSWRDYSFRRLYLDIVRSIPVNDRLWGPIHLGDSVLMTNRVHLHKVKTNKWGLSRARTWKYQYRVESLVSVGHLIHKGLKPNTLLRLASGGYCHDLGLNPDRDGKLRYALSPCSTSTAYVTKQWTCYSSCSSGVDERDPLSVFQVLENTKCPPRLYASDYEAACLVDKALLLNRFKDILYDLSSKVGSFDALSIEVSDL